MPLECPSWSTTTRSPTASISHRKRSRAWPTSPPWLPSRNLPKTCAASPTCATSWAIATCFSAASTIWRWRASCSARKAGFRDWSMPSRMRTEPSMSWPPPVTGKLRASCTAGTRRCCTSIPRSSWCSTLSSPCRRPDWGRRWCARRGCPWKARNAQKFWESSGGPSPHAQLWRLHNRPEHGTVRRRSRCQTGRAFPEPRPAPAGGGSDRRGHPRHDRLWRPEARRPRSGIADRPPDRRRTTHSTRGVGGPGASGVGGAQSQPGVCGHGAHSRGDIATSAGPRPTGGHGDLSRHGNRVRSGDSETGGHGATNAGSRRGARPSTLLRPGRAVSSDAMAALRQLHPAQTAFPDSDAGAGISLHAQSARQQPIRTGGGGNRTRRDRRGNYEARPEVRPAGGAAEIPPVYRGALGIVPQRGQRVNIRRVRVIDSHTDGEPTRMVVSGGPDLGSGPMAERMTRFRDQFDDFRRATVNEPRGHEAIVGALLCEPSDPTCDAGVIFYNNVGYLGMCGHGTIGLVVTLAHMGRVQAGSTCRLETTMGNVEARLNPNGSVTIRNVASYRLEAQVPVEVPGFGTVHGDIAWGGNWFYLCDGHGQELSLSRVDELTDFAWRIRQGLEAHGITGAGGRLIDHIELFGSPTAAGADSKCFVLCPGKAYRSEER